MENKQIILDFGSFELEANLFDTSVVEKFIENLPYTISLQQWGNELYGPIGINLGEEDPIPQNLQQIKILIYKNSFITPPKQLSFF